MTAPSFSILEAMDHEQVWRPWFKNPTSWAPWRAFLGTLFGLPLSKTSRDLFHACTGRAAPPPGGCTEAWLVCGRRAGKSFVLALIACYLGVFKDWKPYLTPGEAGTIKVIATDRKQARVIHRYCRALLTQVPALKQLVERETEDELVLNNGIVIEIQTASFRSVRGFTLIAALCDEIAYWRSEQTSANPDGEILGAIRPAMATVPNAMLLCASSPYARRGELWNAFRRYHGRADAPALVWHAATRTMNPTVRQRIIDEAYEEDPAKASAEYGAQFRSDIEGYLSREAIEAAVVPGRLELAPILGLRYAAFVDPSGGSADSMTLAVAHRDREGRAILDLVREVRPPFSPEGVVTEFAGTLKAFRVSRVQGDRYAGEWPREQFKKRGISYDPAERAKSDLYQALLPLVNSARVELLDLPRLAAQLLSLERRTARSGRDSIDHAPGAHDDLANAVAGALLAATVKPRIRFAQSTLDRLARPGPPRPFRGGVYGSGGPLVAPVSWQRPHFKYLK